MAVEMAAHKLVNLGLAGGMEILKFMHSLEFDDV